MPTSTMPQNPAFLCIGEQRCGTTWLYHALRRHPQIWLPPLKATRYFVRTSDKSLMATLADNRDILELRKMHRLLRRRQVTLSNLTWFARYYCMPRNDGWYASLMRPPPDRMSGEICHAYSGMTNAQLRAMRDGFPDLKLVYVLREPLARSWSGLARRLQARHGQTIDADWDMEKVLGLLRDTGAIKKSSYANAIERLLEVFPKDRLYIGFYDQLQDDAVGFLDDLCRWLNLGAYSQVVGEGPPAALASAAYPAMPPSVRAALAKELEPSTNRLCEFFPNRYTNDWYENLAGR